MPIELKFAKPQSANVAIVNDFGSSIGFSGPSCEYATNSLSAILVPSRLPMVGASRHGTPMLQATGAKTQPKIVGNLLGTRMVLNEFIAFAQLGPMKETLDPRSFTIATFALCGFANFASIGMQIGGIGALVPERRSDLARLGMRAMLAGTMANFLTAIIVGLLL